MVLPGVFAAFAIGLLVAVTAIYLLDQRAIAREREFWEELRAQALDGYGRAFDWEKDL